MPQVVEVLKYVNQMF